MRTLAVNRGRWLTAILIILLMSLVAGCWDRRELDTLAIVSGVGIDRADDPEKLKVTVQIIKPGDVKGPSQGSGGSGGSGGGSSTPAVWVLEGEGYTVFDSIRTMATMSSRRLYFPHSQALVIGKEAARHGVRPLLDFFVRDPEPRINQWIVVASDKASDILKAHSGLNKIPALAVGDLADEADATSQVYVTTIKEFLERLVSKTSAPLAGYMETVEAGGQKNLRLVGVSVFKGDKFVGTLDDAQTRGVMWVLNKAQGGVLVVESQGLMERISLELVRSKSKVTPKIEGGKVSIQVEVKADLNLGSNLSGQDMSTPAGMEALGRRAATVIRNEIWLALQKAQEWNTDIFGFGEAVHRKYPKEWKRLEGEWDNIFPTLDLQIEVKAEVVKVGLTMSPPVPE